MIVLDPYPASNATKLRLVRFTHTAIFVVMMAAVFYIDYCGLAGRTDVVFLAAIGLIVLEGLVFFGNGARCPLTEMAQRYGATKGYVFDSFFPERWTRYTVPVFTSLFVLGLLAWAAHQLWPS
jgi:hypothetical protein